MQQWSEGVYLLGQYYFVKTGCWLLVNGSKAAVVEMPPTDFHQDSPALAAEKAATELGVEIQYLLCTHNHIDHINARTFREFRQKFPSAEIVLQNGFRNFFWRNSDGLRYFTEKELLSLDGEPLYLIHAPKHSDTDTMIIFKGAIITGDWELNTLRSAHDDKPRWRVENHVKLQSIDTMARFEQEYNYRVHKVFSAHANDRRINVNFTALMEDTKIDRSLFELM